GGEHSRPAMIGLEALRRIAHGDVTLLQLHRGWLDMALTGPCALLRGRLRGDAATTTVVADTVHVNIVDDRPVDVHVVDVGDVDVVDGAVVVEVAPAPFATGIAVAEVPVAVIDAAVEADARTPVTAVPAIVAIGPAPPARRPQQTDLRRHHPGARHPVVITVIRIPRPIAGGPDVARPGDHGLCVVRQCRRRDADRDTDADAHTGLGDWRQRQHRRGHETCNEQRCRYAFHG